MVRELRAGVWHIDCTGVNAYLADDDGTLTLIDTGTPRDVAKIRGAVTELGYALADIDRVLITHYDVDHVGGLAGLELDAEIYIGASDRGFVVGDEKPPIGNLKGAIQRITRRFTTPPEADVTGLADGDTVGSFQVYHTPGHTPGHVAYVSESLSVAFVGDLVREQKGQLVASPKPMSYDMDRVRTSIAYLADTEPAVEVLAMGHGVPFVTNGSVRLAELGERIARD